MSFPNKQVPKGSKAPPTVIWSLPRSTRKIIRQLTFALIATEPWIRECLDKPRARSDLKYVDNTIAKAEAFLVANCHPAGDAPINKEVVDPEQTQVPVSKVKGRRARITTQIVQEFGQDPELEIKFPQP